MNLPGRAVDETKSSVPVKDVSEKCDVRRLEEMQRQVLSRNEDNSRKRQNRQAEQRVVLVYRTAGDVFEVVAQILR